MINWRDYVTEAEIDWTMNNIAELKVAGNGRVEFVVQDGKLLDRVKITERERMSLREKPRADVNGNGMASR